MALRVHVRPRVQLTVKYKRAIIRINMLYITTVEWTDSTKLGTASSYHLYL